MKKPIVEWNTVQKCYTVKLGAETIYLHEDMMKTQLERVVRVSGLVAIRDQSQIIVDKVEKELQW